ncbi:LacI family transcriptional regulator [Pararhodobacter aggregans]|uniref:LacI family transcriptional regulator n=3 Tax=Pararhodobacter TaxID=1097465 RepID=A0A2T7UM55_9RHOB|nr:LacI family transcriptional regulator [Pararhodobacter aggregans]PVE45783.1 LacI family transcriptional regulator [Pararhodobacter aggregans]
MRSDRTPTMKDVARRANVSLGTVSRIVNSNATVAPELRRHVEAVIRELGYRPNVSARTMRTRRTHAIGIIVTDLRQPVAATLVAQASEIARRHGFAPIVGDFQNDAAAEERLLSFMAERSVDGLVLTISSDEDAALLDRLEAMGIPVVLWERDTGGRFPSVRTDHRAGARMAAEALRRRGRKRVLLIAGHEHTWTGREQVAGMRDGLGSGARLEVVHTGRFDPATFRAALQAEDPVDAVVANVHDIPAVLGAVEEAGLACPGDLSVISIGDDPFLSICRPAVSAVVLPSRRVASEAAELLLQRLDPKARSAPAPAFPLAPGFIDRKSV